MTIDKPDTTHSRLTLLDAAGAIGFVVYSASMVLTPIVLLRLADELGFGLAQGGGIEAVRAGFLLAVLLVSGAAAARFGRTRSLSVGAVILAAGLLAYAAAPAYWVVLAAMVLVGVGGGVLEALINPMVQDEHPGDSGRYLNVVNAFFSLGVVATVLIAGELLTRGVSWRLLVASVGVLAAASAAVFGACRRYRLPEKDGQSESTFQSTGAATCEAGEAGSRKRQTSAVIGVLEHSRRIVRDSRFWLFALAMFCGGGAEGGFTFWSATYIQLHFDALARAGGVGTAVFAGGMVVGRLASGRFVAQNRLNRLIIGSAVLGIGVSIAAYLVSHLAVFFGVLFAAGLSIACFWPSIQAHAATTIRADSTTLFILLSCAGVPGFGLTSWIMGIVAERYSLRGSLLVIPILLLVLTATFVAARSVARARDEDRRPE